MRQEILVGKFVNCQFRCSWLDAWASGSFHCQDCITFSCWGLTCLLDCGRWMSVHSLYQALPSERQAENFQCVRTHTIAIIDVVVFVCGDIALRGESYLLIC